MKGLGFSRLNIAAALLSLSQPLDAKDRMTVGKATLDTMFRPMFDVSGGQMSHGKPGKHRCGGKTSPQPNYTTDWRKHGTQAKEAARRVARGQHGDDRNWQQRKAWLERNAHVIAKREADQMRAAGPLGGKNATIWGRR
jgi:hypothetical protein